MTDKTAGVGSATNDAIGWGSLLGALVIQGIADKIRRGEPLTATQQALKDAAPSGFRWPDPPNPERPDCHD